MLNCTHCGREMRAAFLTIGAASYCPVCGRRMIVKRTRAKRRDAGVRRTKADARQMDIFGAAA